VSAFAIEPPLTAVSVPERRLAAYEPHAEPVLLTRLERLAARLDGLRVLHLSGALDDRAGVEGLRSLVALERSLGLDSTLASLGHAWDVCTALRTSRWWSSAREAPQADWSAWISMNYRAAAALAERFDVAVVHGTALAGVPAIVRERASAWLWDGPSTSALPARVAAFVDHFDGTVDPPARPGRHVDPLEPANAWMTSAESAEVCRTLGLDPSAPLVCHVSRFARSARWKELRAVHALLRAEFPAAQLVIAGATPAGESYDRLACADERVMVLPRVAEREINALRVRASVIVRGAAGRGRTLDVREAQWKLCPVAVATADHSKDLPERGTAFLAATSDELATGVAELLADPGNAARIADAGHEAIRRGHLVPHLVLRWLQMLESVDSASGPPPCADIGS
jgi:glycosyltransferase involved in cell wall biosynthesis